MQSMTFTDTLSHAPVLLTEGAVIERLRRDGHINLDPHVLNAGCIYEPAGRAALEGIYRRYLDIGRSHHLPMIIFTPTWRASPRRLERAALGDVGTVNRDCCRFMLDLRTECGDYATQVFIGGLTGCRGDAYDPADALSAEEACDYHASQARALVSAGVDFLMAATLPALSEARGIAVAFARCSWPYIISFIVRPNGRLLDGTPLAEAVKAIDSETNPPPTGYLINCVHPTVFDRALVETRQHDPQAASRILGLQANTSPASPEELDGQAELQAEDPEPFAAAMLRVHDRFGTKILGGCCGTDHRHIERIASMCAGNGHAV